MRKFLCRLIVCMLTVLSVGINVYADVTASLKVAGDSVYVVQTAHNNACNEVGIVGSTIVTVDTFNNIVKFNSSEYIVMNYEKRSSYMESFLRSIKSSNLGAKEKNSIYNFIASQDTEVSQAIKYLTEDTKSDLANARKWLAPFTGGIGTFLGVVCLLVFLFLGIGLFMDIGYLALPSLQLILERGNSEKKPFGVSVEAWKVNREIAMDFKNSKNEVSEYLKRRVPVIMICSICIGYLVSGKIYDFFTFIANAFS